MLTIKYLRVILSCYSDNTYPTSHRTDVEWFQKSLAKECEEIFQSIFPGRGLHDEESKDDNRALTLDETCRLIIASTNQQLLKALCNYGLVQDINPQFDFEKHELIRRLKILEYAEMLNPKNVRTILYNDENALQLLYRAAKNNSNSAELARKYIFLNPHIPDLDEKTYYAIMLFVSNTRIFNPKFAQDIPKAKFIKFARENPDKFIELGQEEDWEKVLTALDEDTRNFIQLIRQARAKAALKEVERFVGRDPAGVVGSYVLDEKTVHEVLNQLKKDSMNDSIKERDEIAKRLEHASNPSPQRPLTDTTQAPPYHNQTVIHYDPKHPNVIFQEAKSNVENNNLKSKKFEKKQKKT